MAEIQKGFRWQMWAAKAHKVMQGCWWCTVR